jgi:hypothetical protein
MSGPGTRGWIRDLRVKRVDGGGIAWLNLSISRAHSIIACRVAAKPLVDQLPWVVFASFLQDA